MIKTYVLSMTKEVKRRAGLVALLGGLGVDYELFEAVDGTEINADIAEHDLIKDSFRADLFERQINSGEQGCFISHYRLWKKFIESDEQWICVLESDAQPRADFKEVLESLPNVNQDAEYIMLNYSKCWPSFFSKQGLSGGRKLVRFSNKRAYYTSAYMLHRNGAQKLIDLVDNYKMCMPVDDFISGGRISKDLNTWAVYPRLVDLSALARYSSIYAEGEKDMGYEKPRSFLAKVFRRVRIFFSRFRQYQSL